MIEGIFTISDILQDDTIVERLTKKNRLMVPFGQAACQLYGFGNRLYKINKMYVEFENTAGAVSAPSYTAFDGRDYYDSLSPPKDYLRIDILGPPEVSIVSGYENYFDADAGEGNSLLFKGQTSGVEGVNGLEFSDGVSSRAYGVALVAAPVDADKTQDVIIARGYYTSAEQKIKQASGQILVSWRLNFKPT